MTQAFNLAQLANNLNTTGQLDATDGLAGIVPVANGGSGRSTLTANNLLAGNGTGAVNLIAPGASGNALVSNGTAWESVAGVTQTSFTGSNQSLGTNGFQKLPGGLILQWGTVVLAFNGNANNGFYGVSGTITFPINFTTACYNVSATPYRAGMFYGASIAVTGLTTSGFSASGSNQYGDSSGMSIYWFAIGK
jgi:hypothetical protein